MAASRFGLFRTTALALQSGVGNAAALRGLERLLLGPVREAWSTAPIFIVGPPRTGSTVLSQLLLASYNTSFLSNAQALLWGVPRLTASLSQRARRQLDRTPLKLESEYGYVPGLWSPAEGGRLYREWFERQTVAPPIIRDAVQRMESAVGGPFVSKNLFNSLRIPYIRTVFPRAFFIYIDRNPLWTAQSILLGRRALSHGTDTVWLGPRPAGIADGLSEIESVALQVAGIHREVCRDLAMVNRAQWIRVTYEDLIQQPQATLGTLADAYARAEGGSSLRSLHRTLPDLRMSDRVKLSAHDLAQLEHALQSHSTS